MIIDYEKTNEGKKNQNYLALIEYNEDRMNEYNEDRMK